MPDYYISLHARITDPPAVIRALNEVFAEHGFAPLADTPAAEVAGDDDALPPGDDWYGVVVSGRSGCGWVSVYVEDWQDSGLLSRELSQKLDVTVLEIWVAEDIHWGYTLFEQGQVSDRFADDPGTMSASPEEAAGYLGRAEAFAALLTQPQDQLQTALQNAHTQAGEFAGPGVDALADAVGLPFEHAFMGYEFFFSDDMEDYGPSLDNWKAFRHLAFRSPDSRESLSA